MNTFRDTKISYFKLKNIYFILSINYFEYQFFVIHDELSIHAK